MDSKDDDDDEEEEDISDETEDPSTPEAVEKRKRRLRLKRLKKKVKARAYEFSGGSDCVGIIFLEIGRITDLPPERNGMWNIEFLMQLLTGLQRRELLSIWIPS